MHRPTKAAAVAGRFAHQLRHHPIDARTLGDAVPMAPVIAAHVVIGIQVRARACGDRLFARITVRGAFDHALLEKLSRLFFEAPDAEHGLEELQ
jgi:hypothetical protein